MSQIRGCVHWGSLASVVTALLLMATMLVANTPAATAQGPEKRQLGAIWGGNGTHVGAVGAGNLLTAPTPLNTSGVLAGKQIAQIAIGSGHTCVLTTEGQAFCWGAGRFGRLGNNSTNDSAVPVAVAMTGPLAGKRFTSISAGQFHTCAVTDDGKAACWGYNNRGQLGDGPYINRAMLDRPAPVLVNASGALAGKTVTAVAAGGQHSCALTSDGQAACWGTNGWGELGGPGPDRYVTYSSIPVAVVTTGAIQNRPLASISAGIEHTCGVTTDGQAFCWGLNMYGELGTGVGRLSGGPSNSDRPIAVAMTGVLSGKRIAQISAGHYYTCAVTTDGQAVCWGSNSYGQLGHGGLTSSQTWSMNMGASAARSEQPVAVVTTGVLANRAVKSVSTGPEHACVTTTDGIAACWGAGPWGRLGNPNPNTSVVPVAVNASGLFAGVKVLSIDASKGWTSGAVYEITTPSAPTNLAATSGDRQLQITFSAGATGGSAITNYEYSLDGGATWTALSPTQNRSPVTLSGLSNGTTYNVALRAVNALGVSPASAAVAGTPMTIPASPTELAATPADGQISVAFTAGDNGGSEVTNHEYSLDNGATWQAFDPPIATSPVTISGLTNAVNYAVTLRARNSVGVSPPSSPVTSRPVAAPRAPTNVAAAPANGQLIVTFDPIDGAGMALTAIEYSLDGGQSWTSFGPGVLESPARITGLTNGTTYNFAVRGVNEVGPGVPSAVVESKVFTVPSAPGLAGMPENGAAWLYIDNRVNDGGSSLTGAEYSLDGGQTWTQAALNSLISGLTNGIEYTFMARLVNAAGAGPSSVVTILVGRPAPPRGVTAQGGNGEATVSFWGHSDGGSPITNYEYSLDDGATWTAFDPPVTSSPIVIPNLINGVVYQGRLRGVSAFGLGASSPSFDIAADVRAPVRQITGENAALAYSQDVTSLSTGDIAVANRGSAKVSMFPSDAEGDVSPKRTITGAYDVVALAPLPNDELVVVSSTGLVKVYASDAQGFATPLRSIAGNRTGLTNSLGVATLPDGSIIVANYSDDSLRVFGPGANGNVDPDRVIAGDQTLLSGPTGVTVLSDGSLAVTNARGNSVTVYAASASGNASPTRTIAGDQTGLAAPNGLSELPGGLLAVVNLVQPSESVRVFSPDADGNVAPHHIIDGPAAMLSAPTGVTVLSTGEIAVSNSNTELRGALNIYSQINTPEAPTDVVVTRGGSREITVAYTLTEVGGFPLTELQYSTNNGVDWTSIDIAEAISPLRITSVNNGTAYAVRLRAANAIGVGAATNAITVIPASVPAAPLQWTATPGDRQVEVSVTPGDDGGRPITNYQYTLDGGVTWTAMSPATTSSTMTIGNLVNGAMYAVAIRAVNEVGPGVGSTVANVVPFGLPTAPTITSVTPGLDDVTAAFTPGADSGARITNYQYSLDGGATWTSFDPAVTTSQVTISGLTPGRSYQVALRAINERGAGARSVTSTVATLTTPSAPTGLVATATKGGGWVEFTPGSDGGAPISGYDYSLDGGQTWQTAPSNATQSGNGWAAIAIRGLTNGVTYDVGVRAVTELGSSPASATVTITPDSQLPISWIAGNRTGLNSPSAVVQLPNGEIAVADAGNNSVRVFAPGAFGNVQPKRTISGWFLTQLDGPYGLAALPSGEIAVTNRNAGTVTVYGPEANGDVWPERIIAGYNTGLNVGGPVGIAALPNGELAVANYDMGQIVIFAANADGDVAPVRTIFRGLENPHGVAVLPNGEIAVASNGNHTLAIFAADADSDADPVRTLDQWNSGLFLPEGLAALTDGSLAVTTYDFGNAGTGVDVFAAGANGVPPVWSLRPGSSRIDYPVGLAALSDGTLAVANDGNASVSFHTAPARPAAPTGLSATTSYGTATVEFTLDEGELPVTAVEYSLDDGNTWLAPDPASASSPIVISGLTNGTDYSVALRALNALGPGAASTPLVVNPGGPPAPPVNLLASAEDRAIWVGFEHVDNGGSPVKNFEYTLDDSGNALARWTPFAGSLLGINNLSNGTEYTVAIRAITERGASAPSIPVRVTPTGVEAAPGLVNVQRGDRSIVAILEPPVVLGGPVTAYEYSTDGGQSWAATAVSLPTTGGVRMVVTRQSDAQREPLVNGESYDLQIRAVNATGPGLPTATVPVIPGRIPGAMPVADVAATDRRVTVSWDPNTVDDGGWSVTGFQATARTHDGYTRTCVADAAQTSCTILGLANDVEYQIGVRASNQLGLGTLTYTAEASPTNVETAQKDFPVIVGVQPWNKSVVVLFDRAATSEPATGYEYSTDGGQSWAEQRVTTTSSGDMRMSITTESGGDRAALANGVTYNLQLRAVTGTDPGEASSTVAIAPGNTPGAITEVAATASDGRATVTWDATGVDDGGWALTGFQAVATGTNGTVRSCLAEAYQTSCTILGLENGITYDIGVRGRNRIGSGTLVYTTTATPVASDDAATVEQAPQVIFTQGGNRSITISFDPLQLSAGEPQYEYSTDGGQAWSPHTVTLSPNGTVLLTLRTESGGERLPLTNGVTYQLRVRGVTSAGAGPASDTITAIPGTVPAAMPVANVDSGDRRLTVSWDPNEVDDRGWAINGFQAIARSENGPLRSCLAEADQTSCTIIGLDNDTKYDVGVRAGNQLGLGSLTYTTTATPTTGTISTAPRVISTQRGNAAVTVTFDPPANPGGAITGYEYSTDSGQSWARRPVATPDTGGVRMSITTESGGDRPALTNGVTYDLQLRALTSTGEGEPSDTTAVIPGTVPAAMPVTAVDTGDHRLTVSWDLDDANDRGWAITGFQAVARSDNGTTRACLAEANQTSCTILGLDNDVAYQIGVRALNQLGYGTLIYATNATPGGVIVATGETPTVVSVQRGNRWVAVVFDPPTNPDGEITGYEYSTDGGQSWATRLVTTQVTGGMRLTVSTQSGSGRPGLTNGASYQLQVRGVTAAGAGPASDTITAIPGTGPAAMPVATVDTGDRRVTVTWDPNEVDDRGWALTGFQAVARSDNGPLRACVAEADQNSCTIIGLDNSTEYQIGVRGRNQLGLGSLTYTTTATPTVGAISDAPTVISTQRGNAVVVVNFDPPENPGGAITGYEYSTDSGQSWARRPVSTPATGGVRMSITTESGGDRAALTNGTNYELQIRALTIAGPGMASDTTAVIPGTAPAAIPVTAVDTGDRRLTVNWNLDDVDDRGWAITGFQAVARSGNGPLRSCIAEADQTSCTIIGLDSNTEYEIGVRGRNQLGSGTLTYTSTATPSW